MNAAPLYSAQWFRVAGLRPRLDPQLQVERLTYRREVWHVLVHADGRRSFRLDATAYAFVGRCDGRHSVQHLWELLLAELKDDAPTQDELLQLLARLHAAALLGFDRRPDFGPPAAPRASHEATLPGTNSLLSFRIPLGRPDAWLGRLAPGLRWLFTPLALGLWVLAVLCGLLAALANADALAAHARLWMGTPRMLALLWLAYPVVKALHELAHALAVKHWGGKLPEWGIGVMMFTPVPYVDASAASAFPRASRRLLVSAAGIMAELLLAALALAVGLHVEPGLVRDVSFAVFFIGAVSTLLVNGNPLLRFDGYHMLADALELPNLAQRSARHWSGWLRAHALGVRGEPRTVPAAGEAPWLWAYAPAAWLYRLAISAALVVWLGGLSLPLGVAIALYVLWLLAVRPLFGLLRFVRGDALDEAGRARATRRVLGAGACLTALAALLPLPFSSVVEGVVWLPEQAQVRAETEGFVDEIRVADGERVQAGQTLFVLRAPTLGAERTRLEGRLDALETERLQSLRTDPAQAAGLEHELAAAGAELARLEERLAQLEVRARADGRLVLTHAEDLRGRFVAQGALLAHVLTAEPATVRVAIPQQEAALVQARSRGIGVRLAEQPDVVRRGALRRDVAGTAPRLPSAALGDRGGGDIVTDPGDAQGLTPAQGIVLADVRLDVGPAARVGGRAWVRFEHGHATLVEQAARCLQQLFLEHFNPSA